MPIDRMIVNEPLPDASTEDFARYDLLVTQRRLAETEVAYQAILEQMSQTRQRGGDLSKLENARRGLEVKLRDLKERKNKSELHVRMVDKAR